MQLEKKINEKEYRSLPRLNYSACSEFADNRMKFYKKYVLGESNEEEEDSSKAIKFGSLVHCLLFEPEEFDLRYARFESGILPKPQMRIFVENLWKVTRDNLTEDGKVTTEFKYLLEQAYNMTAFNEEGEKIAFKKDSFEKVVERFSTEGDYYYQKIMENHNKEVIDSKTLDLANKCVSELKTNYVTSGILSIKTDDRYKVFKETPILFNYMGIDMKSMCDLIIVDELTKTIEFYDLKSSGWDIGYFESNVLKYKYYLQWSLYYQAVKSWAKENLQGEYTVHPMKFIVVSTDVSANPLIYTTSHEDLRFGLNGFKLNSRRYKGLFDIIKEINWHKESGIWNISYEDYQNKGIRRISLFEEN